MPAGFTKSSMTASASSPGATRIASGSPPATAPTSPLGIRRSSVESLPVRSCVIDGEAIVVDAHGLSVFEPLRYRTHDHAAVLCAFDLLELDGADFRSRPLEQRKATLAELLHKVRDGIAFNRHFAGDGAIIFKHACALGCQGIVSTQFGSPYRAGRVNHWRKIKNPAAPAVRREAEEDWNGKRWTRGRRS